MSFPTGAADFKNVIPDPTSTLCGNFVKALLKLPVLVWKFVAYMLDDDGNFTQAFKDLIIALTVQTGDIKLSGSGTVPDGWLNCNGAAVNRTTYAVLFAVIGETFGPGDGVNTFNLPDMRDRYALGQSGTRSIGTQVNTGTDEYKHLLTVEELPVHHHYFGVGNGITVPSAAGYIYTDGAGVVYNPSGTKTDAAETRDDSQDIPEAADQVKIDLPLPPAVTLAWYIKT